MADTPKEQPVPKPDKINPQSPPESPPKESPREAPLEDQPDEIAPEPETPVGPGFTPDEVTPPTERHVPPSVGVDPRLN